MLSDAAATSATPPTAAPPGAPILAIAGLALASMGTGATLRVCDALLPRLAQDFGVPLGQAAQVITVFAVAYGLAQLLFGPMGDRFGKYRVVGWACAASALASALCALAPGFAALLAGRLLAGVAAAAVIPLSMAWIGDNVPYAQRQTVLARYLIGQLSGFAMGVWLGGYAAEHLHWRLPFALLALLFGGLAMLLPWVRARLPASASRTSPPAESGAAPLWRRVLAEFQAVFAKPWARVVLLAVAGEGAAFFGAFAFVASHLHQQLAMPLSTAGALVMLFAAGGLGFALAAHHLVPRLGQVQLVRWGAVLMATAFAAIALAQVAWVAALANVAMGLGFYMMHNTLQTHGTQMAPERRGAALAAFAGVFFIGQSLGVAAAGWLVGSAGTGWVLAAGAAGVLATAWAFNRKLSQTVAGPAATA